MDLTTISLIYANVNPDDILLKAELDELAAKHPQRFQVYYVLNNPPEKWDGGVGFVSAEMIKERCPEPSSVPAAMKIMMCGKPLLPSLRELACLIGARTAGPPPMITAKTKHLDTLGYEKPRTVSKKDDQVFCF